MLWCPYHLSDSAIRFSFWTTQLLCSPFSVNPAKSSFFILPPTRSFHTRQRPSSVQYLSPDVLGLWYWGPPPPQAFPLFHFQLFHTPLPNTISSFSLASISANPSACSFLFAKSEPTFQHIPPLGKNFICLCQEIDKLYQVKLSLPPCCGLLFSFNDTHCSKPLCRSGGFKGWSLLLSLSWNFCVSFSKLLQLSLCQIYLDGRSLKQELPLTFCLYGAWVSW